VIACGAVSNTFNIPGAKEHAFFLKDISDARGIRHRVLDCFEKATLLYNEKKISAIPELLHFVIVGGGPTGKSRNLK
jgi:NADH dehydrogenase FAD-containing subunit